MSQFLQELNIKDEREVAAYEQAFYAVFAPITENRLIRWLWEWDDVGERLRTRVPYEEQTVFIEWNDDGQVRRALAIGKELQTVQASQYGFEVPRLSQNCESLTFFTTGDRRYDGTRSFYYACRARLLDRGFKAIYATGAPGMLRLHLFVGAELLDSREIEGEVRNFVRIPLDQPVQRRSI